MAGPRDDFLSGTIRTLAQRAGYICAQPDCRQLTVGPSEDRAGRVTMVGVAAHITAAAPGGPRYNPRLSPAERASEANGLWVCQTHGKMIDDTQSRHTVDTLQRWKTQHEEWVFQRVAAADSILKNGLTSVAIQNVGPLSSRTIVPLGKHNVVFGNNNTGKSSLCECIAAFTGGVGFEDFRKRWRLFGLQSPNMAIEAAVSIHGTRTTVRLSEEPTGLKYNPVDHRTRLHIEVNGNVAPNWPRSLFNVVNLKSHPRGSGTVVDPFRRELRALAPQLGLTEDQVWDALRDELFCSSTFGSRIRRVGEYRAEVRPKGSGHYHATASLAGSEQTFAIFDVLLRMIRADPRPTPWILLVDSSLFLGLDSDNKRRLVDGLAQLEDPQVQTLVCVNSEQDAIDLTAEDSERWIGSSAAGGLTIHNFL